jgi:tetratricopeptide (TPR) repeat protein
MTTPAPVRAEVATQALETALRAAEKLLAQEKYWEVIQTLEPLLGDAPKGRVKQRAQVTIAKAYLKNPNWVKKAEEELQQVVQADPASVEAYMLLGGIYKTGGLKARAVAMFRRALELKPDMDGAAAALKQLGAAPEITGPQAGVGVFLKKLFKRS